MLLQRNELDKSGVGVDPWMWSDVSTDLREPQANGNVHCAPLSGETTQPTHFFASQHCLPLLSRTTFVNSLRTRM
eukprot:2980932-Amphidinium_carterae.1